MTDPADRPMRLTDLSEDERRLLEQHEEKWRKVFEPLLDAIRESERITAADLAVRINTRPEDKP